MPGPTYRFDLEQGTPEWHAARAGKWSSSRAAIIMGGLSTGGLSDYIKDLAWERVHGPIEGGYKSKAMDRGHEVEPEARDCFAFINDVIVVECGLVEHATMPNVVWSPDGLYSPVTEVGSDGFALPHFKRAIEAKCPMHKAYMEVLRTGKVPAAYRWQCAWGCWVGELDGIDFVAHHPSADTLIVPYEIDDATRDQLSARVSLLEPQVQEWVDLLQSKGERA